MKVRRRLEMAPARLGEVRCISPFFRTGKGKKKKNQSNFFKSDWDPSHLAHPLGPCPFPTNGSDGPDLGWAFCALPITIFQFSWTAICSVKFSAVAKSGSETKERLRDLFFGSGQVAVVAGGSVRILPYPLARLGAAHYTHSVHSSPFLSSMLIRYCSGNYNSQAILHLEEKLPGHQAVGRQWEKERERQCVTTESPPYSPHLDSSEEKESGEFWLQVSLPSPTIFLSSMNWKHVITEIFFSEVNLSHFGHWICPLLYFCLQLH